MSKYQFTESNIYLPGTDIPRNRLGIETPDLLHEVEGTLLQQAYTRFITELDPSVCFDEDYFISLHRSVTRSLSRQVSYPALARGVDGCKAQRAANGGDHDTACEAPGREWPPAVAPAIGCCAVTCRNRALASAATQQMPRPAPTRRAALLRAHCCVVACLWRITTLRGPRLALHPAGEWRGV